MSSGCRSSASVQRVRGTRRVISPCSHSRSAVASEPTACCQWRWPAFTVPNRTWLYQHHGAIQRGGVDVEVVLGVHDPGEAHDPSAGEPACGGASDRAEAGALDDRVELHVELGGIAGVVAGAEFLDQVTFRSPGGEVDNVNFVAALDTEQTSHQPDRPGAGNQGTAPCEERAQGYPVELVPRLG
jgi:hypothetical protein